MRVIFSEILKKLRAEKGLSQRELAERLFVTRSTVARWENGSRLPDASMISRLSRCLNADFSTLLSIAAENDNAPNIIMVDDGKIFLSITGFTSPSEAVEYAKTNRVALAFLDIEMGKNSGFDLCRRLLALNPRTNVVYLTAYIEYSYDAWSTGASGFLLKPITPDGVRAQLKNLRYPFSSGGAGD